MKSQTLPINTLREFLQHALDDVHLRHTNIEGRAHLTRHDHRLPAVTCIVSPSGKRRAEIHYHHNHQSVMVMTRRFGRWRYAFGWSSNLDNKRAVKSIPRYINKLFSRRRLPRSIDKVSLPV